MSQFRFFILIFTGLFSGLVCDSEAVNTGEKHRYCCQSRVQAVAHRRDVAREIAQARYEWYNSSHYLRKNTLLSPHTFFAEQKRDYLLSVPYRRSGSRDRIRVPRDHELRFLPSRQGRYYRD